MSCKPNIAYDIANIQAHQTVIEGKYLIDFVCHNIANRILSPLGKTIADSTLNIAGYKLVVMSHMGIYGKKKDDWIKKIFPCGSVVRNNDNPIYEIQRIHHKITTNMTHDPNLDDILMNIDTQFIQTMEIIEKIEDPIEYHKQLTKAYYSLIKTTEELAGPYICKQLYGKTLKSFLDEYTLTHPAINMSFNFNNYFNVIAETLILLQDENNGKQNTQTE